MTRQDGRSNAGEVLLTAAPACDQRERQGQHQGRHQTAGEQGRDRDARDGSDGDQHQGGRDRLAHGAGGRQQRHQLALMEAAALHLGEQHRRHRSHVGCLRPRDAGDQIHRAQQHVGQPAAHMPQQRRQEPDHRPRHAGHLDQQAEEDEQRHGEQDQRTHALVHARDDDRQRRACQRRQIGQRRQPEGEADRHRQQHARAQQQDEEQHEVPVAERSQPGAAKMQHRRQRRHHQHAEARILPRQPPQPQQCGDHHHRRAHRDRRHAERVMQIERRASG